MPGFLKDAMLVMVILALILFLASFLNNKIITQQFRSSAPASSVIETT